MIDTASASSPAASRHLVSHLRRLDRLAACKRLLAPSSARRIGHCRLLDHLHSTSPECRPRPRPFPARTHAWLTERLLPRTPLHTHLHAKGSTPRPGKHWLTLRAGKPRPPPVDDGRHLRVYAFVTLRADIPPASGTSAWQRHANFSHAHSARDGLHPLKRLGTHCQTCHSNPCPVRAGERGSATRNPTHSTAQHSTALLRRRKHIRAGGRARSQDRLSRPTPLSCRACPANAVVMDATARHGTVQCK